MYRMHDEQTKNGRYVQNTIMTQHVDEPSHEQCKEHSNK